MIHYHGLPITPSVAAVQAIGGGHAFVSFAHPEQLALAADICQSFALDNGAYSAWRGGNPRKDWSPYYALAARCMRIPSFDFAVIPDVIDGGVTDNDALLEQWPLPRWTGAPVWHLHEPLDRLEALVHAWQRVCLGSSGEYSSPGSNRWWRRIDLAMRVACDSDGRPLTKLHGLRMLNPDIFSRIPFSSCDSCNIARNIGIDTKWRGPYSPPDKAVRAHVMRSRIESAGSPERWDTARIPMEQGLLCLQDDGTPIQGEDK